VSAPTADGRRAGAGRRARWLAPPLVVLLAGCTGAASDPGRAADGPAPPFDDCSGLTAAPSGGPTSAGAAADLPDLTLPCFTGGQPVRLADLRGPAVINLWGSWCGPCREELPAMQRLADRTAGHLHVIGVDTWDDRPAAGSFAVDRKVTLPTLYDRDKQLLSALGTVNLPVTVFLDAAGKRYTYNGTGLDDHKLGDLVTQHTGVTVQP
jgi:cytochrome c biogenesis protein CcmG/thiol:disulfide interchange protein DsbE